MNVLEQFRLDGKTALVTGARRGIGKAMAIALAEAGADIIAVSVNLEDTGSEIEQAVKGIGRQFAGYRCDFSKRDDVYRFIDRVTTDHPVIDILVNNAGTVLREPAERHPDEYWDKTLETNLSAKFVLSRELGRRMLERGSGKIIFTASLLTFQGGITVPGLRGEQRRIGAVDQGARQRMGGARCTGQRNRARICANGQHRSATERPCALRINIWSGYLPVAGGISMTSRDRPSSSPRPHRTSSMARFW